VYFAAAFPTPRDLIRPTTTNSTSINPQETDALPRTPIRLRLFTAVIASYKEEKLHDKDKDLRLEDCALIKKEDFLKTYWKIGQDGGRDYKVRPLSACFVCELGYYEFCITASARVVLQCQMWCGLWSSGRSRDVDDASSLPARKTAARKPGMK
jgi:hypothetical protein